MLRDQNDEPPEILDCSLNINTFKHNINKLFFKELQKKEDSVYFLLLRTYFTEPVPNFR